MINNDLYQGYNENFLNAKISLPKINKEQLIDIAPIEGNKKNILNYINFSVVLSSTRKFPFFTASNIDGSLFKKAIRKDNWKKDKRAKKYQFGNELYLSKKSDFDKGHMTKREDVQWGDSPGLAQAAANSTFFYSNAVPQHKDLNRKIWRRLEDYILHKETKKKDLKISVFTGPILSKKDPIFVTLVENKEVKIPTLFWKIVYYQKNDGKIYRVGFIMNQFELLLSHDIIKIDDDVEEKGTEDDLLFLQFKNKETYQVNVSLIEKLSGLKFSDAIDSYRDKRNIKLILQDIEIDPDLESYSLNQYLGFKIDNLTL